MTKPHSGHISIIPAAAVFDRRLGNAAFRVLGALGAFTDRSGKCWPATTTIAQQLGITDRRVRAALRSLEAHGYIDTEHRAGQRSTYTIIRQPLDPGRLPSGVEGNPGRSASGGADGEHPGTPDGEHPPNDTNKDPLNNYAFAGKVIHLTEADFTRWQTAYRHLDLRAELQALDDWYGGNLSQKDRKHWFVRCSNALAKKNREVAAQAKARREEPCDSDVLH